MSVLKTIAIYVVAVLVGTFLVSLANTHIDLQALAGIGASPASRFSIRWRWKPRSRRSPRAGSSPGF